MEEERGLMSLKLGTMVLIANQLLTSPKIGHITTELVGVRSLSQQTFRISKLRVVWLWRPEEAILTGTEQDTGFLLDLSCWCTWMVCWADWPGFALVLVLSNALLFSV